MTQKYERSQVVSVSVTGNPRVVHLQASSGHDITAHQNWRKLCPLFHALGEKERKREVGERRERVRKGCLSSVWIMNTFI